MAESIEHSPLEDAPPPLPPKTDLLKHFPDKHEIPPKKILFMGDEKVGKTSFILKYCEHACVYFRCYGYSGSLLVLTQFLLYHREKETLTLIRLMDLPPGTTAQVRGDQYPDDVDAIVLCFAIDNPISLASVWKSWVPEFQKYYPNLTRFYLLGLRSDSREEMLAANKTPVAYERGEQIHEKYKFRGEYMECSVQENPQQAFDLMNRIISDVLHCEQAPDAV